GNFSVAGHRNTYGRAFEEIASLEEGDAIVVETVEAFYVYEVTESLIVMPQDVEVIAPAPGQPGVEATERMLTLTACHPMYSARERYIVHAEFAYWTDRADGIPDALAIGADEAGASADAQAGPADGDSDTGWMGLPGSLWGAVALGVLVLAVVLVLSLRVVPALIRTRRARACGSEQAGASADAQAGPADGDSDTGCMGLPCSLWGAVALGVLVLAVVLVLSLRVVSALIRTRRSRAGGGAPTTGEER